MQLWTPQRILLHSRMPLQEERRKVAREGEHVARRSFMYGDNPNACSHAKREICFWWTHAFIRFIHYSFIPNSDRSTTYLPCLEYILTTIIHRAVIYCTAVYDRSDVYTLHQLYTWKHHRDLSVRVFLLKKMEGCCVYTRRGGAVFSYVCAWYDRKMLLQWLLFFVFCCLFSVVSQLTTNWIERNKLNVICCWLIDWRDCF